MQNNEALSVIQQQDEAQEKMLNEIKENIKMLYEMTISNVKTIQLQDTKKRFDIWALSTTGRGLT